MNWGRQAVYLAACLLLFSPLEAPQLLAFPYAQQIGHHRVYSEVPIAPRLEKIIAEGDALAARSPIADPNTRQPIFLTSGGWRWTWLALGSGGAFAVSRPGSEAIVVNKNKPADDLVLTDRTLGNRRALSATIAHEITHGSIRNHFGLLADWRYPAWLREGYCDYVAGAGSLSDSEARQLIASGKEHPALLYWTGRKSVEAELEHKGMSVDALFARFGA